MDELSRLTAALADRYEIQREIGRGGMATVYLARDLRHDRRVALKLLDSELGAVLGVERFLSEIRVTANLQHPNLLPLFDSGEADGLLFYVMPFVDGESLRARLERERQLPIVEALHITTSICGALDYAHRQGVIHRDLKPENILLHEGQPLLADFGIALAVSNAGGARITQTGLSLGTPQYMSPEQASGDRVIDGRTDIYALGAVTYEMLTGEPPHTGPTAQAVLAKLMVEEPRPVTVLRRAVPPGVDAAVRHALEKLPADRFATAREFADALNDSSATTTFTRADLRVARERSLIARILPYAVALACAAAAAFAWYRVAHVEPPRAVTFKLDFADKQRPGIPVGGSVAVSPDGRTVAYTATGPGAQMLYVRRLDELQTHAYAGGDVQATLSFSPDGRWIAFANAVDHIARIGVDGTSLSTLTRAGVFFGGTWMHNGAFVYGDGPTLMQMDTPGSTPHRIVTTDPALKAMGLVLPFVFPDQRDVMFGILGNDRVLRRGMASTRGGGPVTIDSSAFENVLGYREGWLVFGRSDGAIVAQRFDQRARRFSGDPVVLLEGALWKDQGGVDAALSETGTLVYLSGDAASVLAMVDQRGTDALGSTVHGAYLNPAWSPDGRKVALEMASANDAPESIWIYDVGSKVLSRLTGPHTDASRPAWTPDGNRIAFTPVAPTDTAVHWVPVDKSGPEQIFYSEPGKQFREVEFSPDGKFAVLRSDNTQGDTKADLYLLPLTSPGARHATPLVQTPAQEEAPSISPNGKWLAYQSDETGRFEIYVVPFPAGGGRVQVSTGGGVAPRWTSDGAHIVYRGPLSVWSASIATGDGTPRITGRDSLFVDTFRRMDTDHQGYDIRRDGRMAFFHSASNSPDIVVIVNWWNEVRDKLRGK